LNTLYTLPGKIKERAASLEAERKGLPPPKPTSEPPSNFKKLLTSFGNVVNTADFADSANKFVQAVRSGDKNAIFNAGTDWISSAAQTTGGIYSTLKPEQFSKLPGIGALSYAGSIKDTIQGFQKLLTGQGVPAAANDFGRGAYGAASTAVSNMGPLGFAVSAGQNLGEFGWKALKAAIPELANASTPTSMGELMGNISGIIAARGAGGAWHDIGQGLRTDQRVNSDNVVVKAAGVGAQTVGQAMGTVETIANGTAAIANYVGDKVTCGGQREVCGFWSDGGYGACMDRMKAAGC